MPYVTYYGLGYADTGQLQCRVKWLPDPLRDPYAWSNLRQSYGCANSAPYNYADQTSCATYYTCPPNQNWTLSGNTCTRPDCVLPQTRDAATGGCISELYTITLHDLGGEVMPKQTRDAYAAVSKGDGTAAVWVQVGLSLTVVPELQGQLPSTYTGTLSANTVSIGTTTYSGETGTDGRLNFVFKAPVAGGTHTITAYCGSCAKEATGRIKVPGCKTKDIREVDDIPPNGPDVLPLTQVLERTWGEGLALLPAAQAGLDCVKAKLPGVKISGGTRTVAYQAHLREVWDKLIELNKLKDPAQIQACKPLRDKIKAHNSCGGNGHCITYEPAKNSDHPRGDAFDISGIEDLLGKLRPPPDLQLPHVPR